MKWWRLYLRTQTISVASAAGYILGGVGWYYTHVQGSNGSTNRYGPHAGAGLEVALDRHWSIDGDMIAILRARAALVAMSARRLRPPSGAVPAQRRDRQALSNEGGSRGHETSEHSQSRRKRERQAQRNMELSAKEAHNDGLAVLEGKDRHEDRAEKAADEQEYHSAVTNLICLSIRSRRAATAAFVPRSRAARPPRWR